MDFHPVGVQADVRMISAVATQERLSCTGCAAYELNICHAVSMAAWAVPRSDPFPIRQAVFTAAARRLISREPDLHDSVPFICSGWAASIVLLADGSRQILSFLLPGDIVSAVLLFESRPNHVIEAITDARYCMFKRSELRTLVFAHPHMIEKLSAVMVDEKMRGDRLVVDLGRRAAAERIACLILDLHGRLRKRGMAEDGPGGTRSMEFPLRQHHIADATGLTSVHVSKVLTDFRRRGLVAVDDRVLTIADPARLRAVAELR
jgi:CRP-like cAMP-binding protein